MIKVVIADDQIMMREGIARMIERDDEIMVAGFACNGREAFEQCVLNTPDVVLMDMVMPECDGIEGVRLIKQKFSSIKVIIVTVCNDNERIVKALNTGADGYMLKDINPDVLIMTVKSAVMGLCILHKDTIRNISKRLNKGSGICKSKKSNPAMDFSYNEKEIIRFIAEGKNNSQIASLLFMSMSGVKRIIFDIMKKMGVQDRTQIAVFAIKNDIVEGFQR